VLEVILGNSDKRALISDVDTDLVFLNTFHLDSNGYPKTGDQRKLHKIIASRMGLHGEIDHEDRNKLNCQRENLRLATRQENSRNRTSTTALKGVNWSKSNNKFIARIRLNQGKRIYLGQYDDPMEAARAYDKAALLYFGEFAVLNFPKEGSNA